MSALEVVAEESRELTWREKLNSVIVDFEGNPITEPDGTGEEAKQVEITYRKIIVRAMGMSLPGIDDTSKWEVKFDVFAIGMKVNDLANGKLGAEPLTIKEIQAIKARVAAFSPIVVGRVGMMLDPENEM